MTSVTELNANFEQSKSEIKAKYERQIKILEGQMKREINELKDDHEKAVEKVIQRDLKTKAGTHNEEDTCGTCGVKLDEDPDDPREIDFDKIFICEQGKFCGTSFHCNSHKSPKTICSKCECGICELCVDTSDKCALCWESDILTCCGELKTMPCGELACHYNNCDYYHCKHCNCEEEERDAAFERFKRECR